MDTVRISPVDPIGKLFHVLGAEPYKRSPFENVDRPVPPYVGPMTAACHVPVVMVPTLVKKEVTTLDPKLVLERTLVPPIW